MRHCLKKAHALSLANGRRQPQTPDLYSTPGSRYTPTGGIPPVVARSLLHLLLLLARSVSMCRQFRSLGFNLSILHVMVFAKRARSGSVLDS